MKRFNIFISTVKRPGGTNYLKRLIDTIRPEYDGIIHLMAGGTEYDYIDAIKDPKLRIHVVYEEGLEGNIQKASKGYYDCLTYDRNTSCLILEDDGVLVEGWYQKLEELLTFTNDEKFVLSLISPSRESIMEPDIKIPSIQRFVYRSFLTYGDKGELPAATIVTYSNTTGIYYPDSMLKTRLPEFILKYAAHGAAVYDIVLGQYMFRYNLPIHIAVPNLLKFDVDSKDSSLGGVKLMSHIDYTGWDFTKL